LLRHSCFGAIDWRYHAAPRRVGYFNVLA
jgi:hypothetical protein